MTTDPITFQDLLHRNLEELPNSQELLSRQQVYTTQTGANDQSEDLKNGMAQDSQILRRTREIVKKVRFTVTYDIFYYAFCIAFFVMIVGVVTMLNSVDQMSRQLGVMSLAISAIGSLGLIGFFSFAESLGIHTTFDHDLKQALLDIIGSFVYLVPIVLINFFFHSVITLGAGFQSTNLFNFIFSMLCAFSEETLFALFLTTMFTALSKNRKQKWLFFGVVCVIFALFHFVVYRNPDGTPNWNLLMIMVGLRVCFSLSYLQTKRISVPITLHLINNLLANMPFLLAFMGGST